MTKTHEIKVFKEKYDDINGSLLLITDIKNVEKGDYILIKSEENSFMTKVDLTYNYEGLQEGFVLLKLIKIN